MKKLFIYTMLLALTTASLSSLGQMTAQKVTDNIKDAYKDQIQGIKDITKKTDQGVQYQKWVEKSGNTIYKLRNEQETNDTKQIAVYDGKYYWTKNPATGKVTKNELDINPMVYHSFLKDLDPDYDGKQNVNGKNCHVLKVEDADLDKMVNPSTGESMIPPESKGMEEATVDAKFFVDDDDWVIVKMVFDVDGLQMKGKSRKAKMVMVNEDFRNVEGLIIPYRTVSTTKIDMTAEEKKEAKKAQKSMEEMQEKMKNMSPEKREMMEEYMKPQMEQMGKMKSLFMTGEMKQVSNVQEVKVNTGIPDKLFDGSQL